MLSFLEYSNEVTIELSEKNTFDIQVLKLIPINL